MEVAVDHSGSMGIEMDYYGQKMSRLETVKKVIAEFIAGDKKGLGGRTGDLVGLVTFARYADTACPLVLGHSVLVKFLEGTQVVQMRSEDGTAIGDAIALASARLNTAEEEIKKRREKLGFGEGGEKAGGGNEEYKIKSKVVILLTDGINNVGSNPLEAAELARKWGVKIYAIGIGSGQSYMTIQTLTGSWKVPTGQELDEALLKSIAEKTGGFYSRADDAKSLKEIIEKINKLEKTEVKTVQYAQYKESFGNLTFAALLILAAEMIAGCTVLRKIP
jgi:Ca-activated chloride channel family protein